MVKTEHAEIVSRPSIMSVGRLYWLAFLTLMGIVIFVIIFSYQNRQRNLLDVAKPMARSKEWKPGMSQLFGNNYCPISDSEILLYIYSADGKKIRRLKQQHNSDGSIQPAVLITNPTVANYGRAFSNAISPDGKYIIYYRLQSTQQLPLSKEVYSTRLDMNMMDGSLKHSWITSTGNMVDIRNSTNVIWMPDSKGLICLRKSKDTNAIPYLDIYPISGEQVISAARPDLRSIWPAGKSLFLIGFSPQGRIIASESGSYFFDSGHFFTKTKVNYPNLHLYDFGIVNSVTGIHRFSVHVPAEAEYGLALVSPKGDKICWYANCVYESGFQKLLHKINPTIPIDRRMIEKMWVSTLDGNEMRVLGYYEIPGYIPKLSEQPSRIQEPKWTPDGKHIDFLFKNTVYTIDAGGQ